MAIYDTWFYKTYVKALDKVSHINWNKLAEKKNGRYYKLTDADLDVVRQALASNYYIIATRRNNYVSTYLIQFASLVKTGEPGHYSHVLMNLEGDNPQTDDDYQLYESTSTGVHLSSFMQALDVDSVCLLRPKNIDVRRWEGVVDAVKAQVGKPYDNWFKLNDDTHLSCVELVRKGLMGLHDYEKKFPNLEAQIKKVGNLTPQMIVDCPDFEIILEIRR